MEHPLRRFRSAHNLSLDAFAALVGASKATISRIETGKASLSADLMRRIAVATGGEVSPNDLVAAAAPAATEAA